MLLTEAGVDLVLIKTEKEIGKKLRAFLVEHGHADLRELCERAGAAFVRRFWREDAGCLADCVRGEVVIIVDCPVWR